MDFLRNFTAAWIKPKTGFGKRMGFVDNSASLNLFLANRMLFKPVRTPCVGICSTGIGDDVCRGCKRFSHEVIHWNGYTQEQRRTIADRLEGFLAKVVANYFEIVDRQLLSAQMEHQQIRFQPEQNPYCWIFDLLKAGASQIPDVSAYGLVLRQPHQSTSLPEVKLSIDGDYYQLSLAHYERYFAPAQWSGDACTE